ncbi:Trafficking protein particle complex subunit 31 [Friedmanniomyces endolithicus]|nr:Trafficking protein particle complex subunit 31 [Friedmanniomyces endolithicus]
MPGMAKPPPPTTLDHKLADPIPIPPPKPFQPRLRHPSSRKTIYDRNLSRTQTTPTSLPAFAYLFHALITHHHSLSGSVSDIETRLNRAGYPLGIKLLDLLLYRQQTASQRPATRPTRIVELLQFIHTTLWRALWGRTADALEQSTTKRNEYMIVDNEPVVNTYISIPREMSQLNCAAFVAGIVEGVCDAAGFGMEGVTAHWASAQGEAKMEGKEVEEMWPGKTIFLLRFSEEAVGREEAIKANGGAEDAEVLSCIRSGTPAVAQPRRTVEPYWDDIKSSGEVITKIEMTQKPHPTVWKAVAAASSSMTDAADLLMLQLMMSRLRVTIGGL